MFRKIAIALSYGLFGTILFFKVLPHDSLDWELESERLTIGRMLYNQHVGIFQGSALMTTVTRDLPSTQESLSKRPVIEARQNFLVQEDGRKERLFYTSQLGFSALALTAIDRFFLLRDLESVHRVLVGMFSLGLAYLAIVSFFSHSFVLAFLISAPFLTPISYFSIGDHVAFLLRFAGNSYWAIWIYFVLIGLSLRVAFLERRLSLGVLLPLFGIFVIKFAAGYEFIFSVGVIPSVVYMLSLREPPARDRKEFWKKTAALTALPILAFMFVGVIWLAVLYNYFGSAHEALQVALETGIKRTSTAFSTISASKIGSEYTRSLDFPLGDFLLDQVRSSVVLCLLALNAIAYLGLLLGASIRRVIWLNMQCLFAAIPAYVWLILAKGHAVQHIANITPVVWALFLIPMMAIWFANYILFGFDLLRTLSRALCGLA